MEDRRFIEESFPVKEVGEASAREKNMRRGRISTLHIWWARRPLSASRATAYAALIPAPNNIEEWQRKHEFIIELSKWDNSLDIHLLSRARADILEFNGGIPPKVLDPFAGGGSYPIEALRLGCEVYASDYNPVAVLIEKATLEFPQKFGMPFDYKPNWLNQSKSSQNKYSDIGDKGKSDNVTFPKQLDLINQDKVENSKDQINSPLLEGVKHWGSRVIREAKEELSPFFPSDIDGKLPVAYLWARTINCQNPDCETEIPLIRSFWLAKKKKKKVALYPDVSKGFLEFRIIGEGYNPWPEGFNPDKGFISRVVVTCPICGSVTDANTTRRLFKEKKSGERLIAVVLMNSTDLGKRGAIKFYRLAKKQDLVIFQKAHLALQEKRRQYLQNWGIDPIPDEPIPSTMPGGFHTPTYGLNNWGDLFNSRQQLCNVTFIEKIREAYRIMHEEILKDQNGYSEIHDGLVNAIVTYLALAFSRHTSYNASICWWEPLGERSFNVFGRQALPMVFDYVEQNPFSSITGNINSQLEISLEIIAHLSTAYREINISPGYHPIPTQQSATRLPYPDNFFDVILTDPPYYYSVTYSDLSDFFYVWLKRTIGNIYPDLFSTPLTPKTNEIIEKRYWDKTSHQDSTWYENELRKAFQESNRVLRENGIAVIVYAHKSTIGWETLINALLDSDFVVTSSWPIHTEMVSRLMANESAALASSIYIVARKVKRQSTGLYNDVREDLKHYLEDKLNRLWEEGIGGADFFIAAIGSAIEIFGKYQKVIDFEGNVVRADRLLQEVRSIATDFAVEQILHNGFEGEISELTRLYVLWRWNYGEARVPFDEGRKLSQSCGVDISQEWDRVGFVRKEKEFVRLLGPQHRKLDDLDDPKDLIDVLHKVLLLWEKGNRSELVQDLAESGYGQSEAFYRVAQAISETLTQESKEKKLLDGFLAGRERVQDEVENITKQGKLW